MKKTLVAFAIAAIAVASQGAQIKWSMNSVNDPAGSGLMPAGGNGGAYLFNADVYSTDDVVAALKDSSLDTLTKVGNIAYIDEEEDGYIMATKKDDSNLSANTKYNFFALVVDDVDNPTKYFTTQPIEVTMGGSGTTSALFGSQASASAPSNWKSVAVPEPTSVALLALGLAALGLKRKVA